MRNRIVRFTSVFALIICMMISLLPAPYFAENESDGTEPDVEDYAIPEDAIYIATSEELLALAENCRVNTWSIGKTIVLSNDIDVSGVDFVGIPTFGGTFLGQGHTIRGLHITEKGSVVGFFRYLQKTAIVDGLTIEGKVIPDGSKSMVGGFAGENAGVIKNCVFSGEVSGYEHIGGFVGENKTFGVIENCTIKGSVHGSHFVGGIAGENSGVLSKCINAAEVNNKSVQNSVDLEDITIDNVFNTESANTATDLGGIVGISSGIVRECTNNGLVGYKNMGYNVGGIAGSQSGFLVDCINNAEVQGRKEVGGIVGHMEPNLVLEFDEDGFQILSEQMGVLGDLVKELRVILEDANEKLTVELDTLEKDMDKMEDASKVLAEELNFEDMEEEEEVDWDRVSEAITTLSSASSDAVTRVGNISNIISTSSDVAGPQIDAVMAQLEIIIEKISVLEDNLGFEIIDISKDDTDEDTSGKVSNCINYGTITGEINVGGIAGMMSDETDLDTYEDVETVGEESLHGIYKMRVVVRDCKNFGTIVASKQYVGGIAGQMIIGAVLESLNLGNLDAISVDYVGGIAGASLGVIRNCSSKCIIAGDTYVGGIAGEAKEVKNCYAFVSILAYAEKAGAVTGYTDELPEGTEEDAILGNYYFVPGKDIGGIDGISYAGATEKVDLEAFLQLSELPEELRTVKIRFVVEGQDDQIFTINVGENFAESKIPVLSVDVEEEYNWKIIPEVTEKVLGMGETVAVDYISQDSLSNILFDQTYKAIFDLKSTVIQGPEKNENNLAIILAEGVFAKDTTIQLTDINSDGREVEVTLSNAGVSKIHYLIPSDIHTNVTKLYVKGENGEWIEREYTVDGSYMIFDFDDAKTGFKLVEDYTELIQAVTLIGIIVVVIVVLLVVVAVLRKIRKRSTCI